jgi:hypothetical protein
MVHLDQVSYANISLFVWSQQSTVTCNFRKQLSEIPLIHPDDAAYSIQGKRCEEIRLAHQFECDWVLEVPIKPVTSVDRKPRCEQHRWPKSPLSFNYDTQTPWSGEVSAESHNKTDGNVPVWRVIIEGTKNQQCDANHKRNELPRTGVFS